MAEALVEHHILFTRIAAIRTQERWKGVEKLQLMLLEEMMKMLQFLRKLSPRPQKVQHGVTKCSAPCLSYPIRGHICPRELKNVCLHKHFQMSIVYNKSKKKSGNYPLVNDSVGKMWCAPKVIHFSAIRRNGTDVCFYTDQLRPYLQCGSFSQERPRLCDVFMWSIYNGQI